MVDPCPELACRVVRGVVGVLVPNGLPEALVMASVTGGYRENGD
jgi:hypothetical protein